MSPTQKFLKWKYFVFVCEFRIIQKCSSGNGKEVSMISKYGKYRHFFWGSTMEIKPHSFFLLSLPSHFVFIYTYIQFFYCRFIWESYVNFSFIELIFVMVKLTYLLTYLLTIWISACKIHILDCECDKLMCVAVCVWNTLFLKVYNLSIISQFRHKI